MSDASTSHTFPVGELLRDTFPTRDYTSYRVSGATAVGRRRSQEDRFVAAPLLARTAAGAELGVFAVFDGTVGDFASNYLGENFMSHLTKQDAYKELKDMPSDDKDVAMRAATLLHMAFASSDAALLEECKAAPILDYTSSTGVVALVAHGLLAVAHVGDSRIVLGSLEDGDLRASVLTQDHKPDQPEELRRIEASGGSLTYLHGGKPFIRGGDFTARQAKGDRPMQLNYSRAFGGKDLKPFGLVCEPDISTLRLTRADRVLILASDGVWDVLSAVEALDVVVKAYMAGRHPSRTLVQVACELHERRRSADNVTAVVLVFLDGVVVQSGSAKGSSAAASGAETGGGGGSSAASAGAAPLRYPAGADEDGGEEHATPTPAASGAAGARSTAMATDAVADPTGSTLSSTSAADAGSRLGGGRR